MCIRDRLCITQPSLSHAIAQMEKELGVPLFEKNGRNTLLTPFGREFLACAEHTLSTDVYKRQGTKGFVDILAKDCKDHLTVIEVKKSNSTAREAIHEVFKYLEGVKINKGLRDDEIRLLILSTEWDELLIPFSSLCQNSTVNIEGYRIQVSENRTLSSVKRVQPIMHNHERLFCEHHMPVSYTHLDVYKRQVFPLLFPQSAWNLLQMYV